LADYSDKELSTVIGVVLTEKCQLRNMTVNELIGMGRSPYTGFWGILSRKDRQIVDDAIALVGIEGLKERMVHTLSDGERQKVMIAKALAQETPIIFLDEPTAFLDYPSKVEILHLLHRLSREMNKTIFLSTHDLELALQIADQIWLMDREKGVLVGTPEDLAINGSLENFFCQRKGIAFDKDTGLYRIDNEYWMTIHLEGSSERSTMIQKAFRRNGIHATSETDSEISVFVDEVHEEYVLKLKDKEYSRYSTIKELLPNALELLNDRNTLKNKSYDER
jgi:iron complex transport system ATP-binding protein